MDVRYKNYLQYSEEVPHLFDKKDGIHTVKLDNLFSLPINGQYVKVKSQIDTREPLIARVAHTGIRFIWETKGTDLNCDMCNGDEWEHITKP